MMRLYVGTGTDLLPNLDLSRALPQSSSLPSVLTGHVLGAALGTVVA